jgi:hypothetical protein
MTTTDTTTDVHLESDITISAVKFDPKSVSESAARFSKNAKEAAKNSSAWYEVHNIFKLATV